MKTLNNLSVVIRPVNDSCNLQCSYCNTRERYSSGKISKKKIQSSILVKLFSGLQTTGVKRVFCTWHGGEPLLLSDEFYKEAFALQEKTSTIEYRNHIQTNGVLLTTERLSFFKDNIDLLGFSLDGNKYAHNVYRFSTEQVFQQVLSNVITSKNMGVPFSIMMVLHKYNIDALPEIADFIEQLEPKSFALLPLFQVENNRLSATSITPSQLTDAIIYFYERRLSSKKFVNNYACAVEMGLQGQMPSLCYMAGRCANSISVNGSGDVFSTCQEDPQYYIGNIDVDSMDNIILRHLKLHNDTIEPKIKHRTIYAELNKEQDFIYFQGRGCAKKLINGYDPYFSSYLALIKYARDRNKAELS